MGILGGILKAAVSPLKLPLETTLEAMKVPLSVMKDSVDVLNVNSDDKEDSGLGKSLKDVGNLIF